MWITVTVRTDDGEVFADDKFFWDEKEDFHYRLSSRDTSNKATEPANVAVKPIPVPPKKPEIRCELCCNWAKRYDGKGDCSYNLDFRPMGQFERCGNFNMPMERP